jgi:hypothetical protein
MRRLHSNRVGVTDLRVMCTEQQLQVKQTPKIPTLPSHLVWHCTAKMKQGCMP